MVHTDVIKIISANPGKFEEVYDDFQNLEASCEMVADSTSAEIQRNINVMINSLLKFKTSKFELLADTIGNNQNSTSVVLSSPDNIKITSAHSDVN